MADAVDFQPDTSAPSVGKALNDACAEVNLAWTKKAGAHPFQIRQFRSRRDAEVVVLIDEGVGPAFYANVFVTSQYVKANRSPNTRSKVLRSIAMARTWAKRKGYDFDEVLRTGEFISIEDVESLADYLLLSADSQNDYCKSKAVALQHSANVISLEKLRPNHRELASSAIKAAAPVEAAARIYWVAEYIEWLLRNRLGTLDRLRNSSSDIQKLGFQVLARLRQRGRGLGDSTAEDETLEGVPREIIDRITETLRPGAPGNPFEPGFLQARNYLLWLFFVATGGRRGEIRPAKVGDVTYAMRILYLRESKTVSRDAPIGLEGALAFDAFIDGFWSQLPKEARRRGFIFVDKEGRHISLRQINRIFVRIRERVPEVPDFLTTHTLRRSWNDYFSKMVDRQPPEKRIFREEEARVRRKLQGWSENSEMAEKYDRRHLRRRADELGQELANDITSGGAKKR
jgi:integrase